MILSRFDLLPTFIKTLVDNSKVILKENWNRVLTVSRSPKKQLDTWITVKVFADGSRESSESAIEGRLYRGGFEFPDHVAGRRGVRQGLVPLLPCVFTGFRL